MNILEEFWYGNIEPAEYDTSSGEEYKEMLQLISRNEDKLLATMTDEQKELFTKYADCVREYQVMAECLLFQNSFRLGGRMMLEVMRDCIGDLMVDPAYHFGLLWNDLHATIGTFPVTQEMLVGYGVFAVSKSFPLTPFHIFGDRPGFFLGDAGQQSDEKLALVVHGVNVFFMKCTVCIDSETDECQVISAGGRFCPVYPLCSRVIVAVFAMDICLEKYLLLPADACMEARLE